MLVEWFSLTIIIVICWRTWKVSKQPVLCHHLPNSVFRRVIAWHFEIQQLRRSDPVQGLEQYQQWQHYLQQLPERTHQNINVHK